MVPDVPTLFVAGHRERFLDDERAAAAKPVLTKPFSDDALLRQVADVLHAGRPLTTARAQPALGAAEV